MSPRGFVGAIHRHRLALAALRICYRALEARVKRLEAFREAAEPILVDALVGRKTLRPARNPRRKP